MSDETRKCCGNCKYNFINVNDEPCASCLDRYDENSNWKPKTGRKIGSAKAMHYEGGVDEYRKSASRAAYELGYGLEVIEHIEEADTEDNIRRIMTTARHEMFSEE